MASWAGGENASRRYRLHIKNPPGCRVFTCVCERGSLEEVRAGPPSHHRRHKFNKLASVRAGGLRKKPAGGYMFVAPMILWFLVEAI